MSAFSDFLEGKVGDVVLRGQTYTGAAVYFAIFTSNPTDAGNGNEYGGTGYARQQAHTAAVSDGFTNAGNGVFTNAKEIRFPAIVDGQVTFTHWALYDAVSGGNLLYHGQLTLSKTLEIGDILILPIGSITVTHS